MTALTFEGEIEPDEYVVAPLSVRAIAPDKNKITDLRLLDEIECAGVIDTASPHCFINKGVLSDAFFGPEPIFATVNDSFGRPHDCRGTELLICFEKDYFYCALRVPVFEMTIGLFKPDWRFMLIGRPILNLGIFIYDGPAKKWSLTFEKEAGEVIVKDPRQIRR